MLYNIIVLETSIIRVEDSILGLYFLLFLLLLILNLKLELEYNFTKSVIHVTVIDNTYINLIQVSFFILTLYCSNY